jgi:uncharacterized protein YbjT (DUF2867 family)
MTILVTGSRGRIARTLIPLLHTAGHPVRAASQRPADLRLPDGVPSVALSLADPGGFRAALAGAGSVFLYAGAAHIDEFLAEAEAAGVEHIVLLSSSSVLEPAAHRDRLARHHLTVEEALAASPVAVTVLRPGAFAANAYQWAGEIRSAGQVALPYPGATTDPVHEADIAEAAFAALTRPELRGGAHHLTGPQSLSFADQVGILAAATGQSIQAAAVDRAIWKAALAGVIPEEFADGLLDWWQAHDGIPTGLTDTLEWLIGHPPRTFAEWAEEHAADFTR